MPKTQEALNGEASVGTRVRGWKMAKDLKFKHEKLEELELHNFSCLDVHVNCFNLTRLVVKKMVVEEESMGNMYLECPNLTSFEVDGCSFVLFSIPSMFSALPGLESLTIKWLLEDFFQDGEDGNLSMTLFATSS